MKPKCDLKVIGLLCLIIFAGKSPNLLSQEIMCPNPIVSAEVWFNTTSDDKDNNSTIFFKIKSGPWVDNRGNYHVDGRILASCRVGSVKFNNNSRSSRYQLNTYRNSIPTTELSFCPDEVQNGFVRIGLLASGNDEWHFNINLKVTRLDGAYMIMTYEDIKLNSTDSKQTHWQQPLWTFHWIVPSAFTGGGIMIPPNIEGKWHSNTGIIIDITQNENKFTWTTREREMPGSGEIHGELAGWMKNVRIKWKDFSEISETSGKINIYDHYPNGNVSSIVFDNDFELSRTPLSFNSTVDMLIPDLRGVWKSNIGLTFEITQWSDEFSWTVREKAMPGRGQILGRGLQADWNDEGISYNGLAVIEINDLFVGEKIFFNNMVVLHR